MISTEIGHLQEKIELFQDCKLELQNVVKQPSEYRDIALTRYTRCIVELECKLNQWFEVLKYRKNEIARDIEKMEEGWISYIKKCKSLISSALTL